MAEKSPRTGVGSVPFQNGQEAGPAAFPQLLGEEPPGPGTDDSVRA
jgi:hypothetical protein